MSAQVMITHVIGFRLRPIKTTCLSSVLLMLQFLVFQLHKLFTQRELN